MPSATFTVDAVVANRRFSLSSFISGSRVRHNRTDDHTGTQDSTTVVLSSAIGQYAAGATIQSVLASMATRLVSLESSNHRFATFTFNAFVLPHFWLNAITRRTPTGSFTANAVISLTGPQSFTLNAVVFRAASARTFSLSAFLV